MIRKQNKNYPHAFCNEISCFFFESLSEEEDVRYPLAIVNMCEVTNSKKIASYTNNV